ncbi:DNA topoisomerase IB [Xaviernesmea rhizosphaerae]|uniref:DNA topoisomerase IB n=1 Tax=Xaviernesmea rhizosphaerae TaxID=1672749 RepID=UPI003CC9FFD1
MDQIVSSSPVRKSPSQSIARSQAEAELVHEVQSELVYLSNLDAGITRREGKRGFLYYDADGKRVTDPAELERIAALAIPPAYSDVLISPVANSHLQAIGMDARGRKQYRYHPDWHAERGKAKFALLPAFAATLPKIRAQVDEDLNRRLPGLEKALATVVWLLDNLFIRVGNAHYAEENGSFGATTLRSRHVKISGSSVQFHFKGKSGKEWKLQHGDRRIVRAIRTLQELPGQQLFQYLDEDGKRHAVGSADVNAYIKAIAGGDFSSRQFRTWGATRLAASAFADLEPATSQRERKRQINTVIDEVAAKLVNTRAVCRASYIHPRIIADFETGELAALKRLRPSKSRTLTEWMNEDEIRVLRWLKRPGEPAAT